MAVFRDVITTEGEVLIAKMLSGQCKIIFTRMEWGDGVLATGEDARNIKGLKHKITESNSMTVTRDDQIVYVSADFTNQELSEGMYLREKGIYASDGTTEILMVYANNGSLAEYIAPAIEGLIEKTMRSVMTFNQNDNISVQLKSEAFLYKDDFENHLNDSDNPHEVKYELPEELAELQSRERLSTAFGKIAKAVRELIVHLKDKVMHIDASERNKWNKATQTSIRRSLTSGTKIGIITIDNKDYDLYCETNTDTKNTAGTTNSNSRLYLVGAATQAEAPRTYSRSGVYIGTDGCLYSNNARTVTVGDITQSAAVTASGQKVLDAREKNASIEGTLANLIAQQNSNLTTHYIPTSDNENVSVNGKDIQKYGNVVFVYIDVTMPDNFNGTYTSYEILAGLPKPNTNRSFLGGISIDGVFTQPMLEIKTDGKIYLQVRGTAVNGRRVFATVIYVI